MPDPQLSDADFLRSMVTRDYGIPEIHETNERVRSIAASLESRRAESSESRAECSAQNEELAAIATVVLHADVSYPGGCNLNEPGKLVELVRYLAQQAESSEPRAPRSAHETMLKKVETFLSDPRIGTVNYMDGPEFYEDAYALLRDVRAVLAES